MNGCLVALALLSGARAATLSERLDVLVEKWNRSDGPGIAVALIRKGKVEYRKTLGLADIEGRTPILPDTRFRLCSISKQFTAIAVMMLADEGTLSIDDPLPKYLPEFTGAAAAITIRFC